MIDVELSSIDESDVLLARGLNACGHRCAWLAPPPAPVVEVPRIRDYDLLVAPPDLRECVRNVEHAFRRSGWSFIQRNRLNGHVWSFAAPPDVSRVIEIDFLPGIYWGPVELAGTLQPAAYAAKLYWDPVASFAKRIVLQFLAGDDQKLRRRAQEITAYSGWWQQIAARLRELFGRQLGAVVADAFVHHDFERLLELVPEARKEATIRQVARAPGSVISAPARWLRNEIAGSTFAKPVLPCVAIVGVDGVGKSATITELREQVRERFPVVEVVARHWRPGLLPPLGSLFGRARPESLPVQSGPPRRRGGAGSMLRFSYYALDHLYGKLITDRRASSRLQLVLYDRCALDMAIDPVRFGLRRAPPLQLLRALLPPLAWIAVLVDTPERIRARKPELTTEEIERQQSAWLALAEIGVVHSVHRTDGPATSVARGILDRFSQDFMAPSRHRIIAAEK